MFMTFSLNLRSNVSCCRCPQNGKFPNESAEDKHTGLHTGYHPSVLFTTWFYNPTVTVSNKCPIAGAFTRSEGGVCGPGKFYKPGALTWKRPWISERFSTPEAHTCTYTRTRPPCGKAHLQYWAYTESNKCARVGKSKPGKGKGEVSHTWYWP